jgi:redox-sensitive bicupin YhaK (pirin superfamily)
MSLVVTPRLVKLTTRTEIDIKRSIPQPALRRIGAWVFIDHFGPTEQVNGMVVANHPHTGLQTVTWPFSGRVEHRDSVGSIQVLEPGQLNLMTAGKGISHSEISQVGADSLHATQLWIALPESSRNVEPFFEHHDELPILTLGDSEAKVFIGSLDTAASPATVFSSLVGAELQVSGEFELPLDESFEHGILVVSGNVFVNGIPVAVDDLIYLPVGEGAQVSGSGVAMLIGGEPFTEHIVMWWNFIGRSHSEIVAWREAWNAQGADWPSFEDKVGGWIPAPDLPNVTLQSRG